MSDFAEKKTRRIWAILLISLLAILIFSIVAFSSEQLRSDNKIVVGAKAADKAALDAHGYDPKDTWTIYVYFCGSNLESIDGQATIDIEEIIDAQLPDNVRVLIQTGGAKTWQNSIIDADHIQRYLYHENTLTLIDQQPDSNMGDPATVSDFLSFGEKNYPADHKVFIFWNHGSGSVYGAAFDERFDNDSLTLNEMQQAFAMVYSLSDVNPPFEIIGFDACLMATIDTAKVFAPIARYLVASEELEPGIGWHYTGWLNRFGENTGVNGAQVGKFICDTYIANCANYDCDAEVTLSVIDLGRLPALTQAYDNLGNEALIAAAKQPSNFMAALGRNAIDAENYGGNTKEQGYSNMVDLGGFIENSRDILPTHASTFLRALEDCVVYQVAGMYRRNSSGLSGYFPYNGDKNNFRDFSTVQSASEPFKHLFSLLLNGQLTASGKIYLSSLGCESDPQLTTLKSHELEDFPVDITDDGVAVLTLGAETADLLKSVHMQLFYFDEKADIILALGSDNNLQADWERGVFTDNFQNTWGAINDHLVYMEISAQEDEYNLYSVPILLNGKEYNLRVAYDFKTESYIILGARKGIDESGEADKHLRQLKKGDQITTLHFMQTISDENDEMRQVPIDTFIVDNPPVFTDVNLGDGTFAFMFEMIDMQNNSALSDVIKFTVKNGEITVSNDFSE